MFSLLARRKARSGGSAPRQPKSTQTRLPKNAARPSAHQVQQVSILMTSFPPFDLAENLHGIKEYLSDAVTTERSGARTEVIKSIKNNQQASQKSPPAAKKLDQGQAKPSKVPPTSGPPSSRENKIQPRRLSLSHVRRPSKTQLTLDPRLSGLGPMAAGIIVDD